MRHALRRTAEAVLSSAVTVVVGLLTLLLSLFPATRGLGPGLRGRHRRRGLLRARRAAHRAGAVRPVDLLAAGPRESVSDPGRVRPAPCGAGSATAVAGATGGLRRRHRACCSPGWRSASPRSRPGCRSPTSSSTSPRPSPPPSGWPSPSRPARPTRPSCSPEGDADAVAGQPAEVRRRHLGEAHGDATTSLTQIDVVLERRPRHRRGPGDRRRPARRAVVLRRHLGRRQRGRGRRRHARPRRGTGW